MAVEKTGNEENLRDADNELIDAQLFENDPDGNVDWSKANNEKTISEDMKRLDLN